MWVVGYAAPDCHCDEMVSGQQREIDREQHIHLRGGTGALACCGVAAAVPALPPLMPFTRLFKRSSFDIDRIWSRHWKRRKTDLGSLAR